MGIQPNYNSINLMDEVIIYWNITPPEAHMLATCQGPFRDCWNVNLDKTSIEKRACFVLKVYCLETIFTQV